MSNNILTSLMDCKSMWLYEKNYNNSARYILGIKGNHPLICVGINPSTAEPNKLDRTLKSVESISKKNGFDSWLMINVYPQRATKPDELHTSMQQELHTKNIEMIIEYLSRYEKSPTIWAAWGTLINKRKYLKECLFQIVNCIEDINPIWVTIGKRSKDGHPHHPLYLPHNASMIHLDIKKYVQDIDLSNTL